MEKKIQKREILELLALLVAFVVAIFYVLPRLEEREYEKNKYYDQHRPAVVCIIDNVYSGQYNEGG